MRDEVNFYFDVLANEFCAGMNDAGEYIAKKKAERENASDSQSDSEGDSANESADENTNEGT